MRVGFLSAHNPRDPAAFSGTIHSAWVALADAGVDLVDMTDSSPEPPQAAGGTRRQRPEWVRRMTREARRTRRRLQQVVLSPWEHAQTIRQAQSMTAQAQAFLEKAPPMDLLFGICTSTMLYHLKTDLPIVYSTDTTARLINTSYPEYIRRSRAFHRACDEIEQTALDHCRMFVPTSQCTADSAIRHYGVDPESVRVIEFGAHVVPNGMPIDPQPPTREHLELVLVAADPRRKRLPLCIEVTKLLRKRGWNATLNFVGGPHPVLEGEEAVAYAGRLNLGDPADRETHKGILRRSHWMLLPSVAEAFGIAPCEAAHFGRPSVVTDVGGLPTVVQHGRTGMVVPVDAPAAAYADIIEEVSNDPERYAAMSGAALDRAHNALSWPMWAKRIKTVFEEVLAAPPLRS